MSTPFKLLLSRSIFEAMVAHAKAEVPLECVGLLAGKIVPRELDESAVGLVEAIHPLVNQAASPMEFLSEPKSMFDAYRAMRQSAHEMLAIYHSHPTSAPIPSKKDRERTYGPDVVNVIISLSSDMPEVQAWWLTESQFLPAKWEIKEP